MKKYFHNILALLMSFVVLFSTMSFTFNMHYCGKTVVDVALFKEAKTCGMEMQQSLSSSEDLIMKKGCCTDKQLTFEGQDELKISFDKLTLTQQIFVVSLYTSYTNLFEGLKENSVPFKEYPPPLLVKDIQVLHETFLI
ncbi:HYC_CC_PP family protein [Aquimarina sp. 2304DJ70-9]|uniref:HYC_CC_PP family protein n=1 Tax=Aquimarina penaris TaxID=3231044 RepID=UPI00346180DA